MASKVTNIATYAATQKPHLIFNCGRTVRVVPKSFFEDVISGSAKISDLEKGDDVIAMILSEWLEQNNG